MKNISQVMCNAVVLCASAAILAGCSESTQSLPVGQAPLPFSRILDQHASFPVDSERMEPGAKVLEMFSGGKIHIKCRKIGASGGTDCNFHATAPGTATGVYPGTFTASGRWTSGLNIGHSFSEGFTISSGSSQVTGGMSFHTFSGEGGPEGTYQFESSAGNGTVQVQAIAKNNLQEAFQYQSSVGTP